MTVAAIVSGIVIFGAWIACGVFIDRHAREKERERKQLERVAEDYRRAARKIFEEKQGRRAA